MNDDNKDGDLPTSNDTIQIPTWYDPTTAASFESSGYWVPPLAAGIHDRGDTLSIVVLHHRSFKPAYIRELPRNHTPEQLHNCLAEAAKTVADFNLLLCCAINSTLSESTLAAIGSPGPWLSVRYPVAPLEAINENKYLSTASDKHYYVALALATRLHDDLTTIGRFDHECRHVHTLTQAMRRMKELLLTRLPPDMRRIARLHHDLSF